MDQFHFVARTRRLNANTRFAARTPRSYLALWQASQLMATALVALNIGIGHLSFGDERGGREGKKWAATWTTAPQDVFAGSSTAALVNFAFPNPTTDGANNQTLRMIVKPDLWGNTIRLRFSNTWGTQPVNPGQSQCRFTGLFGQYFARHQHPGEFWRPALCHSSDRAGGIQ
jgi:hypothetical protein